MARIKHTIVTYGGGETLEQAFNAIAAMFNDNEFSNAIYIAAVLFGFWVIINGIARGSSFIPIKWFFWFVISTNLVLYPKTDIKIEDPLTRYEAKVDNVPYLLGSFASAMSSVGHVLTQKMEMYFTLPDYLPYHQTGSVFASKLFRQMGQYKIRDGVLKANLHRFIQNCVVYDAMVGVKYNIKDLQRSQDILSLVSNTSNIVGFTYQEAGGSSAIVSCKEGIEKIKAQLEDETNGIAAFLGMKSNLSRIEAVAGNEFKAYLASSYQFMSKISATAEDILKQEMMINAIQDATKNKAEELGSPHNYAATKALLQQRSTYNAIGEMASQTLAVTKVIFEVLAYSAFIFIAMLIMMPNGMQVLLNYLGLIMWIQLWPPLYAVLNLIMNVAASYKSQGLIGNEGLTMLTSVGFSNLHSDMESMAGYLSMSIPFISYAIVKGGAGSFMNLASSLSSNFQMAASAASEITSGNMSMRNLSYATSSMHNMNAFKHDSNFSHQSGRMESGFDDGSIGFSTASGTSGFRGGQGLTASTYGTQLNLQSHLSAMNSKAMQYEQANINSLSNEYSSAESQALRQSSSLLERMSKSGGQNRSWSVGGSTEQSASLSQAMSFMQELQNRYGYNNNQAAEITASIGMGTGGKGANANMGGSFRSQSEYQDALSKGKQLSDSLGYTENIQKSLRHMDQVAFNENEQFEKGLSRDLNTSFDRMNSIRDSISASQQNLKRYSDNQSFIDTQGAAMNVDISQQYVEWLAGQKTHVNGQTHAIGMAAARKMAMNHDARNAAYTQQFFAEKIPEMAKTLPNAINTGLGGSSFNPILGQGLESGVTAGVVKDNPTIGVNSGGGGDKNFGGSISNDNASSNININNSNNSQNLSSEVPVQKDLAKEAKAWTPLQSMFADNNNEVALGAVNEKLSQLHTDARQPNMDSLPDIKKADFAQVKQGISGNANLQETHEKMNTAIQSVDKEFSASFENEFVTNAEKFNNVGNNPMISNGIKGSTAKHYQAAPETMQNKVRDIENERRQLEDEYKENREKTKLRRIIEGLFKEEKK